VKEIFKMHLLFGIIVIDITAKIVYSIYRKYNKLKIIPAKYHVVNLQVNYSTIKTKVVNQKVNYNSGHEKYFTLKIIYGRWVPWHKKLKLL